MFQVFFCEFMVYKLIVTNNNNNLNVNANNNNNNITTIVISMIVL